MQTVSTRFAGKKLGTRYKSNKRDGVWALRRLPIKKNGKEKRIKYLQNISDATMVITELEADEKWTEDKIIFTSNIHKKKPNGK